MPSTTSEVKYYDYGSRIEHTVRIEVKDEPEDPGDLDIYLLDPAGAQTGPFAPTKISKGVFGYQRTYTSSPASSTFGLWEIMWKGTGVAEGSKTRRFFINSTRFA